MKKKIYEAQFLTNQMSNVETGKKRVNYIKGFKKIIIKRMRVKIKIKK
jgi:hypothetical protein